jgi:hypothetical protein
MKPTTKTIIAAGFLAAGLLATACSGTSDTLDTAGKGQVNFALTSGAGSGMTAAGSAGLAAAGARAGAPPLGASSDGRSLSHFKSANVTFSKIQARSADGTWVDVLIALPATVDMVAIRDGRTVQLPSGFLPPGTYDRLMVTISQVDIVLVDETKISITPPAAGWTVEIPTKPFEVVEGQPTDVRLKFREDMSFRFFGGEIEFEPEFECED